MECFEFDKNNLNKIIESNFEKYYIKWKNAFSSESIIKIYDEIKPKSLFKVDEPEMFINETLINTIVNKYPDIFNINFDSDNDCLKFKNFISSGSSGFILNYISVLNSGKTDLNQNLILKIPKKDEKYTSKVESLIHYSINLYQLSNKIKIVPEIFKIFMSKENYYYSLMEKFDGDLLELFDKFHPLEKYNLVYNSNKNLNTLFIEVLRQISIILIHLQENFDFMHNDLKPSNILFNTDIYIKSNRNYLKNLKLVIADFGGSSYKVLGKNYIGTILGSESNFNYKKDLFLFIHMFLSFCKNRIEIIDYIEENKIFKLDKKIISTKQKNWFKIYTYDIDKNTIDKSFDPRNFLSYLNSSK